MMNKRFKPAVAAVMTGAILAGTAVYVIDVQDPGNALDALMFVLAIDAEKCSRN